MQKRLDGEFYKKGLGQNFIYDLNLLNAIACDGEVGYNDTVLEIGAGAGTLTQVLCSKAKKVISFEIDETLKPTLQKIADNNKNLTLIFKGGFNQNYRYPHPGGRKHTILHNHTNNF